MTILAKSLPAAELARTGFHLYEKFRPVVPAGTGGWGAKGKLDLRKIVELAEDG